MTQSQIHVPPRITYAREDGTKDVFICNEKLGQGGFAVVHRVTQPNINKSYAMKVTLKDKRTCSNSKFLLEKIQNEIQIQKSSIIQTLLDRKFHFQMNAISTLY